MGFPASLDSLSEIFIEKFPEGEGIPMISFHIEDKKFNVQHQLEEASEIYAGAIVEVKITGSGIAVAHVYSYVGEETPEKRSHTHGTGDATAKRVKEDAEPCYIVRVRT